MTVRGEPAQTALLNPRAITSLLRTYTPSFVNKVVCHAGDKDRDGKSRAPYIYVHVYTYI